MFMNATSLRVIRVSEKPFLLNYFPVIYTYMRVRQKTRRIKYITKFVLLHVLITKMNARQCSKRVNIPGAGAGLSKKEEEEEEE